jgi:predicted anti-sigma-YlaC factor YlaD
MNCNEVREHMLDLLVTEPGPGELRDHVKACAACAAEVTSMRRTMSMLDEWQSPADTSPYFFTRLRARVREEQAQPAGWLQWFRKPVLAVGLMVLMVASISFFTGGGSVTDNVNRSAALKPGTAVGDLQYLDRNNDLLVDFELLDDLDGAPSTAQN